MMSIVAYDTSDESETDDSGICNENTTSSINDILKPISEINETLSDELHPEELTKRKILDNESGKDSKIGSLFASLPAPRSFLSDDIIPEVNDDFLKNASNLNAGNTLPSKKRELKPVKITVPSLSEFEDVEEPEEKKPKRPSGSDLFACLPPPKHSGIQTAGMIPHSVRKPDAKKKDSLIQEKMKFGKASMKSISATLSTLKPSKINGVEDSDEDEDLEGPVDFFSLENIGKTANDNILLEDLSNHIETGYDHDTIDQSHSHAALCIDSSDQDEHDEPSTSTEGTEYIDQSSSSTAPQDLFSDEGFLRLHGKKRGLEDIQIIDVSQDEQIPRNDEWRTKMLSEETAYRPSRKKGFMPTSQQRRKHQITYLAFQAKERELELKNEWAQNRLTRRQTQAKYGF